MWDDNEAESDFLNFTGVAGTVAEIIIQADGRPISIGVSGAWGVGKTSLMRLTQRELEARPAAGGQRTFVFVSFNAWLYQGYDDARAALLDVIYSTLQAQAKDEASVVEKLVAFGKRIRWLRATKSLAGPAAALALGVTPAGFLGQLIQLGASVVAGTQTTAQVSAATTAVAESGTKVSQWLDPHADTSPPKEIQALRDACEELLDDMKITLVVLIDDLDRCLPETAISTLEAVRLFLFLRHTAFVVAADTEMIKHAVRRHFEGVSDEKIVTSYFDKLIQVPVRVPSLGVHEVRAFLILLYVQNSTLDAANKETVRSQVVSQLTKAWQGKRVDRAFMQTLGVSYPAELLARFDTADRLAPIMVSAKGIQGNPRLIKRFLNALSIRMMMARAQSVSVDEAVLAKLLLFERNGPPVAYAELLQFVHQTPDGKPSMMADWELRVTRGEQIDLPTNWKDAFVAEWLTLQPPLAGIDVRGALYVSREHAPFMSVEDGLSSNAAELLGVLLESPGDAGLLGGRLALLTVGERQTLLDRLLARAQQEQLWGVPPILTALIALADLDAMCGTRLAAFLTERPPAQIMADIVAKIRDRSWSREVLPRWAQLPVSTQVRRAISSLQNDKA